MIQIIKFTLILFFGKYYFGNLTEIHLPTQQDSADIFSNMTQNNYVKFYYAYFYLFYRKNKVISSKKLSVRRSAMLDKFNNHEIRIIISSTNY